MNLEGVTIFTKARIKILVNEMGPEKLKEMIEKRFKISQKTISFLKMRKF